MKSAYAIGPHVWLVHTNEVAEEKTPTTLPIGSTILTPDEARKLANQLMAAAGKTHSRRRVKA